MAESNGNGEQKTHATITLTLDLAQSQLAVQLHTPNLDCALDMLHRALRNVDNQWRVQKAKEFAEAQLAAAQDAAVRAALTKGGRA